MTRGPHQHGTRHRGTRHDGFILVAVLSVLALLASLVGGTALLTRGALDGVRTNTERLKLSALMRAGLDLAAYQLYTLKLPPDRIAGDIRLDDGVIRLAATDETGLVDLNWAEPPLLAIVASAAGLANPSAFAAAVVAWRSRDEPPRPAGGAATDPGAPKREGFHAIEDLRWLPGVSPEAIDALRAFVTVYNGSTKVNLLAASDRVLLALPGASPQRLEDAARLRLLSPEKAVEQAGRLIGSQQAYLSARRGVAFRVRIEARRGQDSMQSATAILIRAPPEEAPYFITEWRD